MAKLTKKQTSKGQLVLSRVFKQLDAAMYDIVYDIVTEDDKTLWDALYQCLVWLEMVGRLAGYRVRK